MEQLEQLAWQARERAYAPYSNFLVGAALLTTSGDVFLGCNIENASYGLTNCAERTAVFQAIANGHRSFDTLVVCADSEELTAPCGACRQVLLEFAPKMKIILVNKQGKRAMVTVEELMPYEFTKRQLEESNQ